MIDQSLSEGAIRSVCQDFWPELDVLYFDEIGSTHELAKSRIAEGALSVPSLVLAEYQHSGRGRRGTRWEAGRGESLLFNLVLPVLETRMSPTLIAAASVVQAIDAFVEIEPAIKWPNDVYLAGKKVSGVIGEIIGATLIIGIGINVLQSLDTLPSVSDGAEPTSMCLHSPTSLSRLSVLDLTLRCLKHNFENGDELLPFVSRTLATIGKKVEIETGDSRTIGEAVSITPTGALQVVTENGDLQTIFAGRLRHIDL